MEMAISTYFHYMPWNDLGIKERNFRQISLSWYTPHLSVMGCLWWSIMPCHFCHHILDKVCFSWYWLSAVMQWRFWEDPRDGGWNVDNIYYSILHSTISSNNGLLKKRAKFQTFHICITTIPDETSRESQRKKLNHVRKQLLFYCIHCYMSWDLRECILKLP